MTLPDTRINTTKVSKKDLLCRNLRREGLSVPPILPVLALLYLLHLVQQFLSVSGGDVLQGMSPLVRECNRNVNKLYYTVS